MFPANCNAGLQSLVTLPDCSVSHSLIKTVPFLLKDMLLQFFHVFDLVLANAVLQGLPHCRVFAWGLVLDGLVSFASADQWFFMLDVPVVK